MARVAIAIPQQWKALGVWYFPDVDDNQKTWLRYRALMEKEKPTAEDEAELVLLGAKVDELLAVRIAPYTHAEYQAVVSKITAKSVSLRGDKRGVTLAGDAGSIGEQIVLEVCRKRVLEVRNYQASTPTFDDAGKLVVDAKGDQVMASRLLTTGDEFVDFIATEAYESEQVLLDDVFRAIRDESHLSAGQKKTFNRSLASSPPAMPV